MLETYQRETIVSILSRYERKESKIRKNGVILPGRYVTCYV